MIAIVDSGGANLASLRFAFERLGVLAEVTADLRRIQASSHVILPGVAAAGAVMTSLREKHLVEALRGLRQPTLGICLGMQILFEGSDEGDVSCLGILPGRVRALSAKPGFPVPHMGWNRVHATAPVAAGAGASPRSLLGDDDGASFYFVHSFAAPPGPWVAASATYGDEVPSIVEHQNFFGVQFHPEKSGPAGARLLRRFLEL